MKPTINLQKASPAEKVWFALGNTGMQFVNIFVMSYITVYYTNSVGIAAAVAGTILLVSKLADGVSDLIFSFIMEKAHFKMGKARPWLLISGFLMGIGVLLCFNVPAGLSMNGKMIYTLLTYTFLQAVSITVFWLSYNTLFPLVSHDTQDRNVLQSIGNFFVNGGSMLMSLLLPFAFMAWGGITEPKCWSKISVILAIASSTLIIICAIVCKEKEFNYEAEEEKAQTQGNKLSTMQTAKLVFSQKQTWMVLLVFVVFDLFSGISGMKSYICIYVLGDETLSIFAMTSVITTPLIMINSLLMPFYFKKLGRKKVMMIGLIINCIGNICFFAFGRNVAAYTICNVISIQGMVPLMIGRYSYVAELTDTILKKHYVNAAGFCAVAGSLGTKLGVGIGTAMVGWILGWIGFDAAAQQSSATLTGMLAGGTLVPMLVSVALIVVIAVLEKMSIKEETGKATIA